jgi:hypothetical protein
MHSTLKELKPIIQGKFLAETALDPMPWQSYVSIILNVHGYYPLYPRPRSVLAYEAKKYIEDTGPFWSFAKRRLNSV